MIAFAIALFSITILGCIAVLINDSLARESARHYRRVANLRRIAERGRR
jgi:acyl-CoA synthetase (AMP-forming)/AMP-acid ligase II